MYYYVLCLITVCGSPQTLAELKEEESLLLKEKKCLKNVKNSFPIFFQRQVHSPKPLNIFYTCCVNQELASMRDMLKQQRARNESLKKIQQVKTKPSKHDHLFE